LQLSNLRILRARDEEALQYMNKIYEITINFLENNINANNDQPPSSDMITNLAKNYSELKIYDKALKLYDILIKMNDEDVLIFISKTYFSILLKILNPLKVRNLVFTCFQSL